MGISRVFSVTSGIILLCYTYPWIHAISSCVGSLSVPVPDGFPSKLQFLLPCLACFRSGLFYRPVISSVALDALLMRQHGADLLFTSFYFSV
jgi:hypothetical protein